MRCKFYIKRQDEQKLDFLNIKTIKISSFYDESSFERGFARKYYFYSKNELIALVT